MRFDRMVRPLTGVQRCVVAESACAHSYKEAGAEKRLLTCWLFKFGCSRFLPCIASNRVLRTLYEVKECLTHRIERQEV